MMRPPCVDALISAGLNRVVVASTDPFSQVAGQGIERLRAAGISVDLAESGATRRAAREIDIGFFSRVLRQRPWVRMKIAASLDGRPYSIAVGQIDIGNVASDMTENMAKGVHQADLSIKAEPRMEMSGVVDAFMAMARMPLSSNILFTTVMATNMPFVGRG